MAENNPIIEQVKEKILGVDNILVALSRDPSVDEMAAAIGLTMLLDKSGKHATAIYSGATPNALEFLRPGDTFETNTNSLQDFIIALNKEKADHLRYKVEGDYVRVYITPYKTTISEEDLEFSHGDFNVDLVIALNVKDTASLDAALSEYGRIMHDASAINITTGEVGNFGEVKWNDRSRSSVSEMLVALAGSIEDFKLDKEVATAFLTGIIAATDRFSNDQTTPDTMAVAAELMKAGADQKLIADNVALAGVAETSKAEAPAAAGEPAAEEVVSEPEAPTIELHSADGSGEVAVEHGQEAQSGAEVKPEATSEAEKPAEPSATEQLEQMIQPPSEEDNMMEQLRQVANDVKPPEFQPGQNPAEVVAPEMTEKEANNIPEMNFGGGVNITPPSEAKAEEAGLPAEPKIAQPEAPTKAPEPEAAPALPEMPEGMLVGDKPFADAKVPEPTPVALEPVAGKPATEPAADANLAASDDIQLPPPPAPPVDTSADGTPALPQIEIRENSTLPEENTDVAAPASEDKPGETGGFFEAKPANSGATDNSTEGGAVDNPAEFKIPGM